MILTYAANLHTFLSAVDLLIVPQHHKHTTAKLIRIKTFVFLKIYVLFQYNGVFHYK